MMATKAALYPLLAVQLLAMAALEMSGPFWPLYLRDGLQLSGQSLQWWSSAVYGLPLLGALLSAPYWGRLGDLVGHKYMIMRALLALALTQALMAYVDTPLMLALARLGQGLFAGFIAAAQAYALAGSDRGVRTAVLGRLQAMTALGSLVGPILGGVIMDGFGFQHLLWSASLLCAGLLLPVGMYLSGDRLAERSPLGPAPLPKRQALGVSTEMVLLLLLITLVQLARMMPKVSFALYTDLQLQATGWQTGFLYALTGLAVALSSPRWGRLFDSLSSSWQVPTYLAGVALFAAVLMLAHVYCQWFWLAALLRVLWGLCLGALLPVLLAALSEYFQRQGQAIGWGQRAVKLGGLLGVGSAALVVSRYGAVSSYWLIAALYLLVAVLLFWSAWRQRRSHAATLAQVQAALL